MDAPAQNPVKTTEKSLRIVEALRERGGCRITDLAEELALGKSTVHNHLSTLREWGYVTKSGEEYRLGLKFLEVGVETRGGLDLYRTGKPVLDRLEAESDLAASLYAVEGDEIVLLTTGSDSDERRNVGARHSIYEIPEGWVVLAESADHSPADLTSGDEVQSLLDDQEVDPDEIRDTFTRVRERGLVTRTNWRLMGHRRVIAPISVDDAVLGTICLTERRQGTATDSSAEDLSQQAAAAVEEIEQSIAGSWYDSNRVLTPKHSWQTYSSQFENSRFGGDE